MVTSDIEPDTHNGGLWPDGFTPRQVLRGHDQWVTSLQWLADGQHLVTAARDNTVRVWHAGSGIEIEQFRSDLVRSLAWAADDGRFATSSLDYVIRVRSRRNGNLLHELDAHMSDVLCLAASPDGQWLASGSADYTIRIWSLETGEIHEELVEHSGSVLYLAWNPDGTRLASASQDTSIRIWNIDTGQSYTALKGHNGAVQSLAWSPDGHLLASGGRDGTIRLWHVTDTGASQRQILQGHNDSVNAVSFAHNGRFLASASQDETIGMWYCETSQVWRKVATLPVPSHDPSFLTNSPRPSDLDTGSHQLALAFHPNLPVLATIGSAGNTVRIWELDFKVLRRSTPTMPYVLYTNAKVVLLGESGVGKTSLGLVLRGLPCEPQLSTHGREVNHFEHREIQKRHWQERRETLLWDMAGQQHYRLLHQLYLSNVALALVVFDSSRLDSPLDGVHYWVRALRQAQRAQSTSAPPPRLFLVAARTDHGTPQISQKRLNKILDELQIDGYFVTSAVDGKGIPELKESIRSAIHWDKLPRVSSTQVFQLVKNFLDYRRRKGPLLPTVKELYHEFIAYKGTPSPNEIDNLEAQFETCIRHVETFGLVRRFNIGGRVLLAPELLNVYATALINAAGDDPEGLGRVDERDVWDIKIPIPAHQRIRHREYEKLLMIATVDDLLRHEIALRDNRKLIFPSQFNEEEDDENLTGQSVTYRFEGAIMNIYATLVVRLAQSGQFRKNQMWKSRVEFRTEYGEICGIHLSYGSAGRGELTLFFAAGVKRITRNVFDQYIYKYLADQVSEQSIEREYVYHCQVCGFPVPDSIVKVLKGQDRHEYQCPNHCEIIQLYEPELSDVELRSVRFRLASMDKSVNQRRERERAASRLAGKEKSQNFDVFLAHHIADRKMVAQIAERLTDRGIYLWMDREQTPPRRWIPDVIQKSIPKVKSVAIFLGPNGLGDWTTEELMDFLDRWGESRLPVIAVLLPNVANIPEAFLRLQRMKMIYFFSMEDTEALDNLEEAITGNDLDRNT